MTDERLEKVILGMIDGSVDPVPENDVVNVYFSSLDIPAQNVQKVVDILLRRGEITKRDGYLIAVHNHPNHSYLFSKFLGGSK